MKIGNKFNRIRSSELIKSVVTLTSGSVIAQVLGVLLSPILSRLYTPEDFGVVGSLLAITGVISLLGSLKYDLAMVVENDDQSCNELLDLNLVLNLVISFITGIILILSPKWLNYFEGKEMLVAMLPFGVGIIFFSSIYNSIYARFNREKNYKIMAISQIVRRFSTIFFQVIFGLLFATSIGLVLGQIIGVVIPLLFLLLAKKNFKLFNFNEVKNLISIGKKYYKYPFFTTPQSFINLLSAQLPIFVLGHYFQISVVGAYFFSLKLVQVPSTFIGLSVRQVFFREAALRKNKVQNLKKLFYRLTISMVGLMFIPMVVVFIYGASMFELIFGNEWILAGEFASWMFLWYGSNIITGPARSLFLVMERHKLVFMIDIVLFIIRIGSLLVLSMNYSEIVVIKWFSIISVVFNLIVICLWVIILQNKSYSSISLKNGLYEV